MLLPLLYFEATEAVLLYLVSGVALKVETSRWLSSGKLVAPKEDNIQFIMVPVIFAPFTYAVLSFSIWAAAAVADVCPASALAVTFPLPLWYPAGIV